MSKLPITKIDFQTVPPSQRYDDFAIECRRDRSQIAKAVELGQLNWGEANGIKMVVLDDLARAYKENCKSRTNLRYLAEKAKPKTK